MRIASAAASILLFLVMLYLLFVGPRVTYADQPFTVQCGSVAGAGWPGDSYLDFEHAVHVADEIPSGVDSAGRDGILRDCDQRRTTYSGFMALLAVPATLTAGIAIRLSGKRKSKPGPQPRAEFLGETKD